MDGDEFLYEVKGRLRRPCARSAASPPAGAAGPQIDREDHELGWGQRQTHRRACPLRGSVLKPPAPRQGRLTASLRDRARSTPDPAPASRELSLYEDMPAPWAHPGPALLSRPALVAELVARWLPSGRTTTDADG